MNLEKHGWQSMLAFISNIRAVVVITVFSTVLVSCASHEFNPYKADETTQVLPNSAQQREPHIDESEIAADDFADRIEKARPLVEEEEPFAQNERPLAEKKKPLAPENKTLAQNERLLAEKKQPITEEKNRSIQKSLIEEQEHTKEAETEAGNKQKKQNAPEKNSVGMPTEEAKNESITYINTYPYKVIKKKSKTKTESNTKTRADLKKAGKAKMPYQVLPLKKPSKQAVKNNKNNESKKPLVAEPTQVITEKTVTEPEKKADLETEIKPEIEQIKLTDLSKLPLNIDSNWTVNHDIQSGCALSYRPFLMADGQGETKVNVIITSSKMLFKTKSNIDLTYPNLGLQIDANRVFPIEGLHTKSSVSFTKDFDAIIEEMLGGKQLTLMLGFWPTWPMTQAYPLTLELGQFGSAYQVLNTCVQLRQEL